MALTQEELDRKKFSGEGTGITRKPVPTVKGMLGAADRAIGRGVGAVAGVPGKVMNAITPERRGYSGEVDPVAAVGGFMPRVARSAPNTFGGAEMAASAGQRSLQGLGFGSAARAEQPAPVAAQMDVPVLDDQSKVAARENLTGTPAPAATPANPVAQPQGFRSVLSNGMTMTGDMQGNRTYTMGTHGQDGYGRMVVPGGQNAMAAQSLVGGRPQAQSPYSFEGSPEDRARFMRQPTRPAMQNGNAVSPQRAAFLQQYGGRNDGGAGMEAPKYLGPESGLGWKTRLAKYQSELDAYEKATGNRAAMDLEAMRQAGAGQRSMADANARMAENQAQLAEQRRQFDEQAPGRQADAEAKQFEAGYSRMKNELAQRWQQATDPTEKEALYRQMLGMEGKEPKSNIQMIEEPIDPNNPMSETRKVPVQINPDRTYTRLQEQGGQQQAPQAPPAALDYLKKNPGQAAAFKQKYGYLPPGF